MNIDQYISRHRQQLDSPLPQKELVWLEINRRVEKKKRRRLVLTTASLAASITALLFLLPPVWSLLHNSGVRHDLPAFFVAQQASYEQQFKNLSGKLVANGMPPSLWPDQEEISQTDYLIRQYTTDLHQNGPNTELINTLLDLHRKKILLLERIAIEIQNEQKNEIALITL